MTPQQREELLKALDRGDDVRAVTVALQISAKLARDGDRDGAMAIRDGIDARKRIEERRRKRRQDRLDIAAKILPHFIVDPARKYDGDMPHGSHMAGVSADALRWADVLLMVNDKMEVSE